MERPVRISAGRPMDGVGPRARQFWGKGPIKRGLLAVFRLFDVFCELYIPGALGAATVRLDRLRGNDYDILDRAPALEHQAVAVAAVPVRAADDPAGFVAGADGFMQIVGGGL